MSALADRTPHLFWPSSKTSEWPTPQSFFDELNAEFGFDLDPCSTHENAKCDRHFTAEEDGLRQEWKGTVYVNPPYGKEIGLWVEKAYRSSLAGATVVCLLPANTDTRWFHDWCLKGELRFVKGRLKFGDGKDSAPFASVVVVFRPAPIKESA